MAPRAGGVHPRSTTSPREVAASAARRGGGLPVRRLPRPPAWCQLPAPRAPYGLHCSCCLRPCNPESATTRCGQRTRTPQCRGCTTSYLSCPPFLPARPTGHSSCRLSLRPCPPHLLLTTAVGAAWVQQGGEGEGACLEQHLHHVLAAVEVVVVDQHAVLRWPLRLLRRAANPPPGVMVGEQARAGGFGSCSRPGATAPACQCTFGALAR